MQRLSLSDNELMVSRGRASIIWCGWILLTILDLLFDLPGPIGFMCTLILANEWMRTLPGIPIFFVGGTFFIACRGRDPSIGL